MNENLYITRDLERTVQAALRELVGHAEPSPAMWQGIRERILAERSRQRAAAGDVGRMRTVLQALAACAVVAGIGLGVRFSSSVFPGQMPGQRDGVASVAEWRARATGYDDALSGRQVWLAAREPAPQEEVRVGGALE
jgi:hypothetical protein